MRQHQQEAIAARNRLATEAQEMTKMRMELLALEKARRRAGEG